MSIREILGCWAPKWYHSAISSSCCCCCCLHIKSRSDLYSVLSNIRTGSTDANALRGHRLTTQKGYTLWKKPKGNKQKSEHTRGNWKRKRERKQKNKAPDSQTSQTTCQTREIDRAHRSHSTREAKQNKTNKKNQGSPIKTIKSHDSPEKLTHTRYLEKKRKEKTEK